jgi:ribosomal protein S18 acetylase RimI-like enzyme
MVEIRPYRASDLDSIYDICLKTGHRGADASHLYADPTLLGHGYAGPYCALSPQTAFVVEDDEGVGGYILGPADTRAFEAAQAERWWPDLRMRYADVVEPATPDEHMRNLIHHPQCAPGHIVDAYPAHLHIDLLARLRGKGWGRQLIDRWRAAVGCAAHLVVGVGNTRAVRFYRAYGFREIERHAAHFIVFGIGAATDAKRCGQTIPVFKGHAG